MWSDVRADDGTVTIIQPLIAPLYDGKSAHEVMAAFSDGGERSGYDIVREFWAAAGPRDDGRLRADCITGARRRAGGAPGRPRRQAGAAQAGAQDQARRDPGGGRGRTGAAAVAVRSRVAQVAARRPDSEHGVPAEDGRRPGQLRRPDAAAAADRRASRSSSAPTRASTTAASRTTRGCRSCRSR